MYADAESVNSQTDDELIAEMFDMGGAKPEDNQPEDEPDAPTLYEQIEQFEGEADALKGMLLDHISDLAAMDDVDFVRVKELVKAKRVTAEWLRTELTPLVNKQRRGNASGARHAVTWHDIIAEVENLGFKFQLNMLDDSEELVSLSDGSSRQMTDVDESVLLVKLHERGYGQSDLARHAFTASASENRFHPVKQYFESLKWDKRDHIGRLAGFLRDSHDPIVYANGQQRTVIHAALYRWLIGAAAKVYSPRDAQNFMLILDGIQGKGKSYLVRWLCPLSNLHFEGAIRPDDKDYLRYLTTKLVWEVSELGATMRKADREALKSFITQIEATFRPPFGRRPLTKPALASFIGTVNFEGALLNDPTGHRRFWPVELLDIQHAYAERVNVNQVWAQAFALFRKGESWALSEEERLVHAKICEKYEVEDILESHVRKWFVIEPGNVTLHTPTTAIIHHLKTYADVKVSTETAFAMKLATTMKRLGLAKERRGAMGYVGLMPREA